MTDTLQPAVRDATGGEPPTISGVSQRRVLRTPIPGPRSQELHARKTAAVAAGSATTLPVYVVDAGGGILVDADGNQLIDFGSGIAVTTVGNAAPRVVEGVHEQVDRFTHTCFMVTPYEGYVEVCEALNRLTPGHDDEKRSALFNSGAEAVENAVKIARRFTGRDAVAVFDHAYHGRTNLTMAMTAKNMPYKDGFGPFAGEIYRAPMSYPFREPAPIDGPGAAARAIIMLEKQVGADRLAAVVIEPDPGRGRFRRAGAGVPRRRSPTGARRTGCSSSPTRSRAASPAPATCSPATTRASCPTSSRPPRGSPAACRWPP